MEHEEHLKLLSRVAAGNKQAFEQLYKATSGQLYAVSLRILVRKELAEEAVQEAFVKIWHNAGDYQTGSGTVLTWMISIARYRALDMLRYHKVRQEQSIDEDTVDLLEDELESLSDQQKRQIDFCLNELEIKQRQAIHLAYYCGMSHQEVTQHSDSPLGTTKSLIRRGIILLKRCLGL